MASGIITTFCTFSTAAAPLPAGVVVLAVTIGKLENGVNSFLMPDTWVGDAFGAPVLRLHTPRATYVKVTAMMTPAQRSTDAAAQAGEMVSFITRLVTNPLVRARPLGRVQPAAAHARELSSTSLT